MSPLTTVNLETYLFTEDYRLLIFRNNEMFEKKRKVD